MSDIHLVEKNADELIAWAAGLFDADGSASFHVYRKRARTQPELFVYQAGVAETPEVLRRFREIVGCGTLLGPTRGRLWCWRVSRVGDVALVGTALWPWMGSVKRAQLLSVARQISDPALLHVVERLPQDGDLARRGSDPKTALAWAGGFFVGEGWFGCRGPVPSCRWPQLRAAITQGGDGGVPMVLPRFQAAMVGIGSITGPYVRTSPWSKQPQYRWSVGSAGGVRFVIERLWPWLDESKRTQAETALATFEHLHLENGTRRTGSWARNEAALWPVSSP